MNKVKWLFVFCAGLVFLAGCAETQQYKTTERVCVPNLEKARAMEAAEKVLGEMGFAVAKADAERGFLRTRPLRGAQFFEFWRKDNVGAFNTAEANLHSIQRIVELDISAEQGQLCIGCVVRTQRLNLPERQVHSRAQTYEISSTGSPSKQELKYGSGQMGWVDLGKDAKLATKILRRISSMLDVENRE
jgi:hypothetical protein